MSEALIDPQDSPLDQPVSPVHDTTGSKTTPPSTEPAPATSRSSKPTPPAGAAPGKKPLSLAQLTANRENLKKSTGPKTEAGKAASSANALKTGIYAQKWLAVTADEQAMANHVLDALRQQFPARDLLDEVTHEMFVLAYMQWWRFIQAYGGMMDARRGQIPGGSALDGGDPGLAELEECQRILTTALEQLNGAGRLTADTLTQLEAILESSPSAVALIAELRGITAETTPPAAAVTIAEMQRLASGLAAGLEDTKATLRARIAKQEDAAYRQAALPSDAEAKKFLRYERDAFRRLQRAADAITRRWGRPPALPPPGRNPA